MISIKVKRLNDRATLPRQMTPGASGFDVFACLEIAIEISPLERVMIPTGLTFEIQPGYEIQVRPRSGLALKFGLSVLNSPGTIDSDYRGELKILMINLGEGRVTINPHDRIAQLVIQKVEIVEFIEIDDLSTTTRSDGGFGSTG